MRLSGVRPHTRFGHVGPRNQGRPPGTDPAGVLNSYEDGYGVAVGVGLGLGLGVSTTGIRIIEVRLRGVLVPS